MARIKEGILGGFQGKVGTVSGSITEDGKCIIRSLPKSYKKSKSADYVENKSAFGVAQKLSRYLLKVVRIGFALTDGRPYNQAISYYRNNVVEQDADGKISIDFTKLLISIGTLTPLADLHSSLEGNELTETWTDNSGKYSAKATDQILLAVVDPMMKHLQYSFAEATRADGKLKIALDKSWKDVPFMVYAGCVSADGKMVANSVMADEGEIGLE